MWLVFTACWFQIVYKVTYDTCLQETEVRVKVVKLQGHDIDVNTQIRNILQDSVQSKSFILTERLIIWNKPVSSKMGTVKITLLVT